MQRSVSTQTSTEYKIANNSSFVIVTDDLVVQPVWENLLKKAGESLESCAKKDKISPETALHYAVWTCNKSSLHQICRDNPKCVNTKMHFDITPLHLAVYRGFSDGIDLLMEYGAKVDCVMKEYDIQPIHIAASCGSVSSIKRLLEGNATVEDMDSSGKTALHWAASQGHTNCVRELIKKRSKLNSRDDRNDTPLCLAFRYGHALCIRELVKSGGNIACLGCMDGNNDQLLRWSIIHRHLDCVEAIVNRCEVKIDIYRKDQDGISLLKCAMQTGDLPCLRALLRREGSERYIDESFNTLLHIASKENMAGIIPNLGPLVNVNELNRNKFTALHLAAQEGYLKVCKALLEVPGILVNEKNKKGCTPLYIASSEGHVEIVKTLLEDKRILVNEKQENSWTPLHIASRYGYVEVVKSLLEDKRILVNEKQENSWTPLHFASKYGHVEVVKSLLEDKRILANEKNNNGQTPLDLAKGKNHSACVNELDHFIGSAAFVFKKELN